MVYRQSEKHWPHPEQVERVVIALRWFALVVVFDLSFFDLSFFDLSTEGVLLPSLHLILIAGAYNLLILLLRDRLRLRRRVLNVLALDTVIATLSVYLTGGVHSSFFILYLYVTISSALYLNFVPSVLVNMFIAVLYILICLMNPAGIFDPVAVNILATKLTVLLMIGLVSAFLLEGLRREHFETDREALLAARLAVLNDLFQQLTAAWIWNACSTRLSKPLAVFWKVMLL